MSPNARRSLLIALLLLLLALLALFFARCSRPKSAVEPAPVTAIPAAATPPAAAAVTPPTPPSAVPEEKLTSAIVKAPAEIGAGAIFRVEWTGPDNPNDYVTMVPPDAPDARYGHYVETRKGPTFDFTAPIEPGDYEMRYVASRSKKVLGRAPIKVQPATATLDAPASAVLGTTIAVTWTGPNNPHDYVTVVAKDTPDGRYQNYTETAKGSPLKLTLPVVAGEAELRYMTGQGAKVLARRDLKILAPEVSLDAAAQVTAGTVFKVAWTGPNNPHDYVTIVPQGTPDGQYRNYTETAKGSPLALTALIAAGDAELRYMTGSGAQVLARRPITVVAATVTLDAPAEVTAGAPVTIEWTGPNNRGDYLTVVRKATPDGQYARYTDTSKGSPLKVDAPMDPGPAEIRYVSGQGSKVLARRELAVIAAKVSLKAPPRGKTDANVAVEWTGPNNAGDYLTIVPKSAADGVTLHTVLTARGTPASVRMPKAAGPAEVRYLSGQGGRVLARADIEATAE